MTCFAVIDTNVLVSALLTRRSDSAPVVIIEKVFSGKVVPVFCKKILEEYYSVLQRDKFGFDSVMVTTFLHEFQRQGLLMEMAQTDIILPDMKDMPFYAVSLAGRATTTYLITGNLKHFPARPFIVSPARFLELLLNID